MDLRPLDHLTESAGPVLRSGPCGPRCGSCRDSRARLGACRPRRTRTARTRIGRSSFVSIRISEVAVVGDPDRRFEIGPRPVKAETVSFVLPRLIFIDARSSGPATSLPSLREMENPALDRRLRLGARCRRRRSSCPTWVPAAMAPAGNAPSRSTAAATMAVRIDGRRDINRLSSVTESARVYGQRQPLHNEPSQATGTGLHRAEVAPAEQQHHQADRGGSTCRERHGERGRPRLRGSRRVHPRSPRRRRSSLPTITYIPGFPISAGEPFFTSRVPVAAVHREGRRHAVERVFVLAGLIRDVARVGAHHALTGGTRRRRRLGRGLFVAASGARRSEQGEQHDGHDGSTEGAHGCGMIREPYARRAERQGVVTGTGNEEP